MPSREETELIIRRIRQLDGRHEQISRFLEKLREERRTRAQYLEAMARQANAVKNAATAAYGEERRRLGMEWADLLRSYAKEKTKEKEIAEITTARVKAAEKLKRKIRRESEALHAKLEKG